MTTEARRWAVLCEQFLPWDQPFVADKRCRDVLNFAAARSFPVGGDGRYWVFKDLTALSSNSCGNYVIDGSFYCGASARHL